MKTGRLVGNPSGTGFTTSLDFHRFHRWLPRSSPDGAGVHQGVERFFQMAVNIKMKEAIIQVPLTKSPNGLPPESHRVQTRRKDERNERIPYGDSLFIFLLPATESLFNFRCVALLYTCISLLQRMSPRKRKPASLYLFDERIIVLLAGFLASTEKK